MKTLELKRSTAIKIFEALGFKTVSKWNTKRLEAKIKNLPELTDGVKLKNNKLKKKIQEIIAAEKVVIIPSEKEAKEDTKIEKQVEESKKRTTEKKQEKVGKKKSGTGVIASIVSIIQSNGPISKEQIHKRLVKLFPNRPAVGLKSTINAQIPNRLNKEKGLKIKKDDEGRYFIK